MRSGASAKNLLFPPLNDIYRPSTRVLQKMGMDNEKRSVHCEGTHLRLSTRTQKSVPDDRIISVTLKTRPRFQGWDAFRWSQGYGIPK